MENLKEDLIKFNIEEDISFSTLRTLLEDLRYCESSDLKIVIKTEEEQKALNKIYEIRKKYSSANEEDTTSIDIILFLELYNLIKEKENTLRRK